MNENGFDATIKIFRDGGVGVGDNGFFYYMCPAYEEFWMIKASDDRGSCSFGHDDSLDEAVAKMVELKLHEDNARYTEWVIVKYTPGYHVQKVDY